MPGSNSKRFHSSNPDLPGSKGKKSHPHYPALGFRVVPVKNFTLPARRSAAARLSFRSPAASELWPIRYILPYALL